MVSKTTKYEQKRAERFIRRNNERRERFLNQDPVYDICESLAHAFITLIDEFTQIDDDTIRTYLNEHKSARNEKN